MPAQFFGVFMSVNPVLASLAGIVVLGQVLDVREWVGVLVVVAANAVAMSATARRTGPGVLPARDGDETLRVRGRRLSRPA